MPSGGSANKGGIVAWAGMAGDGLTLGLRVQLDQAASAWVRGQQFDLQQPRVALELQAVVALQQGRGLVVEADTQLLGGTEQQQGAGRAEQSYGLPQVEPLQACPVTLGGVDQVEIANRSVE